MLQSIHSGFCKFGCAALLTAACSLSAYAHCGTCGKGDDKPGTKEKCDECHKGGFIVSIEGMHCPACEAKVAKAVKGIEGVKTAKACHKEGKVCVVMADEKATLSKEAVVKALAGTEFKVVGEVTKCEEKKEEKKDGKK